MKNCKAFAENIFRVSFFEKGAPPGSGLDRYGFLKAKWPRVKATERRDGEEVRLQTDRASLLLTGRRHPRIILRDGAKKVLLRGTVRGTSSGGMEAEFHLAKDERLFGFGDQTRERIEQRGAKIQMWIRNVASYIPIPFVMSSRGYGIFVNTTLRHNWDVAAGDSGKLRIRVPDNQLDLYLFTGSTLKEILSAYTELTGRPMLPPKWSFGLWFICRMQANDFEVMSDAANFRDRKIPCDVIGLEPGWMDKFYDYSVEKRWDPGKFPIPSYAPKGPHNFTNALKRMGYKLELWLCNDYDLSHEAERRFHRTHDPRDASGKGFHEDDCEKDVHFTEPIRCDKITRPEEPWFEHLKKFIDQGADFFKQDGALQCCEHPDRLWANGMSDREMHNLYPLLYSQQMYEGYRDYTGKRPCCFTPAGWAGLQRYTGTWTGDTGGGPKTLAACLNLALSGHSLVTCDMEVTTREGIHYGFLMPWAQVNSWNYFRHPWLQGEELCSIFRDYAQLRSRLIPYLYTYAREAHASGIPMMRPMVLEFPKDRRADGILTQYFLGREILVTAFSEKVYLPEGRWRDYWTGNVLTGPKTFRYSPPKNRGGGLFVRANSIIPLGPALDYVGQTAGEGLTLEVFMETGGSAEFSIYEDDGTTFAFEKGRFSLQRIKARFDGNRLVLETPRSLSMERALVRMEKKPESVALNGRSVPFAWAGCTAAIEARKGSSG
ncbi:MAG: glycoside hydrolase family 31 protein [Verrucomicrobia bacterium]|nr:glycoside hydrolase family 31 protein [Verrucomicrobiota bacterium]